MARNVYRVVPDGEDWKVTHAGQTLSTHTNKDDAIETARTVAKANQPSQVVVHKQDGTIQTEYTYGDDPFPPPG